MQVVVDGTAINYTDEGKGRVILMIHGWKRSLVTFSDLTKELAEKNRVVRLDLPGFGKSGHKAYDISGYAELIADFLEKVEAGDPHCMIGHSMGGQIAIHAVAANKVKPRKLILLASSGIRNENLTLKRLSRSSAKLLKNIVPASIKDRFYRRIGSDYSTKLSEVEKKIIDNVLSFDIQEDAGRIKIPTLLIYGEEDQLTPISQAHRLQEQISGSRLEVIPSLSHNLHEQNPEKVVTLIKEFL